VESKIFVAGEEGLNPLPGEDNDEYFEKSTEQDLDWEARLNYGQAKSNQKKKSVIITALPSDLSVVSGKASEKASGKASGKASAKVATELSKKKVNK
jgi:hypothetical protein